MKWTQEHDDWPKRSSKWAWQHDDWPHFEYDQAKAFALSTVDFQLASRQLHGNIEALSASDRVETLTNLMLSEVLNTNLIEGEILNRDSVRSSLLVLLGAYFTAKLPPITRQSCHPFHTKAATHYTAKLPPLRR